MKKTGVKIVCFLDEGLFTITCCTTLNEYALRGERPVRTLPHSTTRLTVVGMLGALPLQHVLFQAPAAMPALNASLQVANLVEMFRNILHRETGQGRGNPYRAAQGSHTALTVFNSTLSKEKGENTADVKELGENITNIVVFIQSLIGTHGKRGAAHFRYIAAEMEGSVATLKGCIFSTANVHPTDISRA